MPGVTTKDASHIIQNVIEECRNHLPINALYPTYSSHHSRLSTYETWPPSLRVKPNALSEAGFFYTGKGDQVVCFACGGGLRFWADSDSPWEEHAMWFNECSFVLSIKGNSFVDQSLTKFVRLGESQGLEISGIEPLNAEHSGVEPQEPSGVKPFDVTPQEPSGAKPFDVAPQRNSTDNRLCRICYIEEINVLLWPCCHIVVCAECIRQITTCAVCRNPYVAILKVFLS